MREPDFNALAQRLLESGITARHAHRAVNELRDHYDDLVDEAVDEGCNSRDARARAMRQLGSMDDFIAEMQHHRELKTWSFRYPKAALIIYPLACLVALPALPLFAGIAHRITVARWGAALLAGGLITAMMMLALQLSILFA